MGRRSTIQTPANEEPIVQRPVAQLQHPGRMLQHSAGTEDWAARSDIFYDSRFKSRTPPQADGVWNSHFLSSSDVPRDGESTRDRLNYVPIQHDQFLGYCQCRDWFRIMGAIKAC